MLPEEDQEKFGDIGLNPFEIRAGLLQEHWLFTKKEIAGLNPFEIRAGLLQGLNAVVIHLQIVLIPSKSGLGCYGQIYRDGVTDVLIPSKSGLGCYACLGAGRVW